MELKDFVSGTLIQIIDGVKQAQGHAQDEGAAVNPPGQRLVEGRIVKTDNQTFPMVQDIEFNVVVSTSEGGEVKGGIGIFVGALGLGTQASSQDLSEQLNRISFKIPLILPSQPK